MLLTTPSEATSMIKLHAGWKMLPKGMGRHLQGSAQTSTYSNNENNISEKTIILDFATRGHLTNCNSCRDNKGKGRVLSYMFVCMMFTS